MSEQKTPDDQLPAASAGTACSALRWTREHPKVAGWYWFQTGDDSPPKMTRLVEAIVFVGRCHDSGICRCVFPQGTYSVVEMGGRWAGPITEPVE